MLINVAETLHDKIIGRIADEITERYHEGGARVVLVAGPSSSGKTTTTKRLSIHLLANLIKPQMISLDNYFVDREHTPRDEHGEYDYESLYALDIEQFNKDLNALIRGEKVAMPTYDFATGKRVYKRRHIATDRQFHFADGRNPRAESGIDEKHSGKAEVQGVCVGAHHAQHRRPQLGANDRQPLAAAHHPRLQIPWHFGARHNHAMAEREKRRRKMDFPLIRRMPTRCSIRRLFSNWA